MDGDDAMRDGRFSAGIADTEAGDYGGKGIADTEVGDYGGNGEALVPE